MTKKRLRYSFNVVLDAAEKLNCKDLHHKKAQQHGNDFLCPVEYEIARHCNIVREYMKSIGL